ncbi:2-hydroxyacid dehydrogenase [Oceanobacillus jeddahense]|uniref:2-hydroxyacid dehydrogenase n=1 Tax=Oceanobacillus jeddahense TaxID=1462527 RepID=A0ABY5JSX3_9BACI|nr:2-hydroxyacid dehydrogenase [Oceanobacillus jeddahense]UUI03396.1 2-hydroxyacid dehydrogenase [Oceanobacillus jeddahense]
MKCLAFADLFIPKEMMQAGLKKLEDQGVEVTVREWTHNNIEALQEDNLAVEQGGSEVISLPDSLLEDIDTFDMIITQFAPINKKVLKAAANLKLIGVLRGGTENINHDIANDLNIDVYNTPGRNARSVAEFAVGLILAEIRNITRAHTALKDGNWRKDFPNSATIPELGGRTVGIIGYGNIGQLVGRFLTAFDMNVIFYDPYFKGETNSQQIDHLDTLLEKADVVTLHGRLTEDTKHMIRYEHFQKMKETAIFVNSARSGLVNEQDLVRALQEKEIMGAAIDTFDEEPLPSNSPFLQLDNVTITTHLAGSTNDAFKNTPNLLVTRLLKESALFKA